MDKDTHVFICSVSSDSGNSADTYIEFGKQKEEKQFEYTHSIETINHKAIGRPTNHIYTTYVAYM